MIGQPSPVAGNDGSGRRRADSISAGSSGSGGVRPVEAVKIAGQLGGIQARAWIGDGKADRPAPL